MARIARIVIPGKAHLVCQGGERPLFNSTKRRAAFTEILATCAEIYKVKILAYALLSKQAYFVIIPPSAEALSSFMRVTQTRFARYLHANGFKGEVTPRRFASCPLDDATALEAIKFVETRPVAEGSAKSATEYAFSSAAARNGHADKAEGADLLTDHPAITGQVRNWAAFHDTPLDPQRAEWLAMRMRTGKPAGAPAFIKRIEKKVGMNLSRGRGRPKGS
ncbi:MAG: hypothetical protein GX591_15980 [Planctomycetes bacterium]|nr:hypothetical protein [Planctomycetota bacterium]